MYMETDIWEYPFNWGNAYSVVTFYDAQLFC